MTAIEEHCQFLMDHFGYVAIAHDEQHPLGSVLKNCVYRESDPMPTLVVIGYCTADDFGRQCIFGGTEHTEDSLRESVARYEFFHRTIAE